MAQSRHWEQDKDATVYIGNIDERATPVMVYEIMLQMGPIHNIHMPRDRVTQNHQGFGFVEFRTPQDAEYAANVMNGIKLYGKSLRVNKASADKQKQADIGAELFVGNLDPMVDEKTLYDTFSRFGQLVVLPKVARDDNGMSKGFGFVSFSDFDCSDAALETMHGQYILSKEVSVQYAFKKDGKGERHGDEAERELAAQAKKRNIVPESQPLPQAFLNNTASGGPRSGGPPRGALPPPVAPSNGALQAPPGFDPSHIPMGIPASIPGAGAAPMHAPPPNFAHHPSRPVPYSAPQHGPPHSMPAGAPGHGPGIVLPPAPSGLPARPPQGQGGFTNPADFHPGSGFRGPPGASPGVPPGFAAQGPPPPPGFAQVPLTAPPPGVVPPGVVPPGVPPGFMPPPGFQRR